MARNKTVPEGPDPANVFTRQNVDPLAAELGVSDEERVRELTYQLNSVGCWYHCMRDVQQNTSHPTARKKIGQLEKAAEELLRKIDALDHQSMTWLRSSFRRRRGRDPRKWLAPETARRVVEELLHAARHALEESPKRGGRPNNNPLHQACQGLASLYEDFSGKKFANEKSRGVRTKSADWVSRAARIIDPEVTDSELDTSLRYAARDSDLRDRARREIPWVYEDVGD